MVNWLSKNRQDVARVAGTVLALILLVMLLKEESGAEVISALKSASPVYMIAAIFSMLVSRLFVAGRWYALLRSAGLDISYGRTTRLTFSGLFASNFLPTTIGGDVARLAGAMQFGYDRAICLASLIADRLVGMAGMIITLPFGLIPVMSLGKGVAQFSFAGLFFNKGVNFIKRTLDSIKLWLNNPLGLFWSLVSTFGNMAFIFISIYLLILGFGAHVPYGLIAGLYSLTYFVTLMPFSINGFGVQELSITFLFSHFGGLDHSQSLTIAVLIRLLFIITSLPGALFLPAILAEMNVDKTNL